MKKVASAWALLIAVSTSTSLFAGIQGQGQGQGQAQGASQGQAQDQNSEAIDLAGLKAKCNELQQNEQLKPFKAVVSCSQVETEWRPSKSQQAGPLQIANSKVVGASFTLKGYEVPFKSERIPVSPALASCNLLEQVKKTVPAVDIELECSALNDVQSVAELCTPVIEARLAADPSIEMVEKTGKTFNTCNH